jgi:histidine phosphotransfer protein HptB
MTFSAPIDRHRLQEYSGGDINFEQELLELFVTDAQQHLTAIEGAVTCLTSPLLSNSQEASTAQNLEIIYQEAHHLKGASGNIGAYSFQAIAAKLEQDAKQGLAECCAAHLSPLNSAFAELVDQIQRWSAI